MEIDFASIIIGLASIAIFLVPVGYFQIKEKNNIKNAKRQFLETAQDLGFQAGEFDILKNRAVIGIDKNREELLYVNKTGHNLIQLVDVEQPGQFKSSQTVADDSGTEQLVREIGLQLKMREGGRIRLPVFEGRDGTQTGNEQLIIQDWVHKIDSAKKELSESGA